MYPQIVVIFFLLMRECTGQVISSGAMECLQGSLENLSNSTAITLSWVSLISTGNFTVNVTNVTMIEIPTTNDPNLTVVISNLCPQSAYEVYVSGPPYLCVDSWQSTYYTQSSTSSLDITSGVLSFMAQSMVHSNESVQSPNRISVTFSWDIPTVVNCEIINYTLRWSGVTIGSAASSPYVWLNASAYLSPFTQYSFTITPVTIIGDGDTQTVSITTVADIPYSAPQELTGEVLSSSQIRVSWSPPTQKNGIITNYLVCNNSVCNNVTLLSNTIDGLSPAQDIVVTVSAFTSQGEGPSASTAVTTFAVPGVVANLMYFSLGSSSLVVIWEEPIAPKGIIYNYGIRLWQNNLTFQEGLVTDPLSYRINNLMAFVRYELTVYARNSVSDEEGTISTIQNVYTQEEAPPPPMLTEVARSQSTISITWTLSNFGTGNLISFEVWYAPTSSVLPERYQNTSVLLPADQYSLILNGTEPSLAYTVQVRARSGAGFGPFSPVHRVKVITDFQTLSSNGTNVFQVRLYGNILCNNSNETQLKEIEQQLAATLADYCDCAGIVTESNDTRLLCNTEPNWFIFRAVLEEEVVVYSGSILQQWMQSQSPHIILGNQVLLVDSSCPSFTNSVNSNSCMTTPSELAAVVAGTFFGALLLGFLLTTTVTAVVIFFLRRYRLGKMSACPSKSSSSFCPEEEGECKQEEYEPMNMLGVIEQSNDQYEYPQVLVSSKDFHKNKNAKVEDESGYENPLELVPVSTQNKPKNLKNRHSKKQKGPQKAVFNSTPQVAVYTESPISAQPHPTIVVQKQDLSVANEYTTEKEHSLKDVEAAKKEASRHASAQQNPYEVLTLAVSESAPPSQQHPLEARKQKKNSQAKQQSKQQQQDAISQPVPTIPQPPVAVTQPPTAKPQPPAATSQPAVGAVAKPFLKIEKKKALQAELPTQSEPSDAGQFSLMKAKLKKTSPAPAQGHELMRPNKEDEKQPLKTDQAKSKKQMHLVVMSVPDLAQVHAHRVQGTSDRQACVSPSKQPPAFQIRTDHKPPEKTEKGKKKKSQSTPLKPMVPIPKSSAMPTVHLKPTAHASQTPDQQQTLPTREDTSSSAGKHFWLEKSQGTAAQSKADGPAVNVSLEKKTSTMTKPTTQPKPKGKSTGTMQREQNASSLSLQGNLMSHEQHQAMEMSTTQEATGYANFGLGKWKK